jgi:uncharacterized protein YecT (DUF1311 family)
MKILTWIIILALLIALIGCTSTTKPTSYITIEVTREVTREVTYIIQATPIPSITSIIPTPTMTPTISCYDNAVTQYDMNQCAGLIAEEQRNKMEILVNLIKEKYSTIPQKEEEFLQLQAKWEDLANEECRLWYGRTITDPNTGTEYYENGSMAPMLIESCLKNKYEDRIKELQILYDF